MSGETDLTVSIPCSRCLTEVPTDIHIVIDKKLRMDGTEVVDDEMEETDYLIGLNLDIDKLIYGEILVNWPMKVLCREDCKGICKVCGMNLNKGTAIAREQNWIQEWQQSKMSLTNLRRCK